MIAVVVAARDAAASLPSVLAGLAAQTLPRKQFELVVADNGSRDSTAEIARAAGATVVSAPSPNRSLARNGGAAATQAGLLVFLDADCVPEPDWLAALEEGLREHPLCAGRIVPGTGEPPNAIERLELLWRFNREQAVTVSGWAGAANLGVRREVFEAIGGFDPTFKVGEDVEFCLRAGRAGFRLGWCPRAVAKHPAEARLRGLARRGFRHGYASTDHHRRIGGGIGRRYWRHPGPLVRGDWPLRRFGVEPATLAAGERRRLMALARLEYAARVAGSAWAELRRTH